MNGGKIDMPNLKVNFTNTKISEKEIMSYAEKIEEIHKELNSKANKKDEFLGWMELPNKYNKREFEKIKKCAKEIRRKM